MAYGRLQMAFSEWQSLQGAAEGVDAFGELFTFVVKHLVFLLSDVTAIHREK